MHFSVVIPTLNEANNIIGLLQFLKQTAPPNCEVIVSDGGSSDETPSLAKKHGAKVIGAPRGRSCQMNAGAKIAMGDILYFVHADVRPPETWAADIAQSFSENIEAGCFSYCFDSNDKLLKINARVTRRNSILTGGGDQTLFIPRELFFEMGGFREELCIMEDFDFVWRLKKRHSFKVIPNDAIVSARKYEQNGYLKVQLVNLLTMILFRMGWKSERLKDFYKGILTK